MRLARSTGELRRGVVGARGIRDGVVWNWGLVERRDGVEVRDGVEAEWERVVVREMVEAVRERV